VFTDGFYGKKFPRSRSCGSKLGIQKEWLYGILLFVLSLILVTVVYYFKPYIDNHFSMKGVDLGLYHLDWGNWLDVITTSIF
jgi:nicotinamide mononucleotide transporter